MKKIDNILLDFVYDGVKYLICTDDTQDNEGNIKVYTVGIDSDGNYFEPTDADIDLVSKAMLESYTKKIEEGEL